MQERGRSDQPLILMFKVVNGLVVVTPVDLGLIESDGRTRHKHRHKFREHAARTEEMRFSFTNRTIIEWNDLPALVAEAEVVVQLDGAALPLALSALLPALYSTRTRIDIL